MERQAQGLFAMGNPPSEPDENEQFAAALCANLGLLGARALMLAGDAVLAEDLVQTTFERALRARHRPPTHEIQPWMMRILKNVAIDHWRSAAVRQSCELDLDRAAAVSPDDKATWWHDLGLDDVARAAKELPATYRALILLRIEGCSNSEIARRMGLKVSTVATRFFRGRTLLQKRLAAACAQAGVVAPQETFR